MNEITPEMIEAALKEWRWTTTTVADAMRKAITAALAAAPAPQPVDKTDAEDEAYELGKRDGYSEAVQQIDQLTGGDGEYRYCTDHDPDRHTPGPAEMIQRIVDRFETLNLLHDAQKSGRDQEWGLSSPPAEIDRIEQENDKLKAELDKWLDMSSAPKDGTILRLLVNPDQDEFTAFDDSQTPFETIGFNNHKNTKEDQWEFAGWDWSQDCFISGRGEVIGWTPFKADRIKQQLLKQEIDRLKAENEQLKAEVAELDAELFRAADLVKAATAAKARIAELEASEKRMREAMEPFAEVLDEYDPLDEDDHTPGTFVGGSVTYYDLTLGDLRRARASLAKEGE